MCTLGTHWRMQSRAQADLSVQLIKQRLTRSSWSSPLTVHWHLWQMSRDHSSSTACPYMLGNLTISCVLAFTLSSLLFLVCHPTPNTYTFVAHSDWLVQIPSFTFTFVCTQGDHTPSAEFWKNTPSAASTGAYVYVIDPQQRNFRHALRESAAVLTFWEEGSYLQRSPI